MKVLLQEMTEIYVSWLTSAFTFLRSYGLFVPFDFRHFVHKQRWVKQTALCYLIFPLGLFCLSTNAPLLKSWPNLKCLTHLNLVIYTVVLPCDYSSYVHPGLGFLQTSVLRELSRRWISTAGVLTGESSSGGSFSLVDRLQASDYKLLIFSLIFYLLL